MEILSTSKTKFCIKCNLAIIEEPHCRHCANTNIMFLNAPYHAAVRRSIRAFPTSPIKAILSEAGLPHINYQTMRNTVMLIPRLLYCRNELIFFANQLFYMKS
ncbi:PREDICTED: uncharacterized protein LOC108974421 [Bactrocera latifrons]|uniref:uncharacterized protein LOC108974421 n=1 Tax=Bactrocera latifrons TaxID=174628 RepID=UPI0008DDF443|nr:PREDICTED: uncharacterized protein LOC108974421 [Bactrocera latifrons]